MDLIYIILGIVILIISIIIIFWVLRKMKGSMDIIPEKYSYNSGETIKGKLILKIKKPITSSKLIVGLKCEKTEKDYSKKNQGSQKTKNVLFDFNQPLDGVREYQSSEYPYNFSINIPKNVSQKLEGIAGTLVKSVQILSGKNSSMKWYLYAELQCKGINLSKKVQINIA